MPRLRARRGPPENGLGAPGAFEPRDLSGLFTAPRWLNDFGTSAWLAVGIMLFVVAMVWVLSLTQAIVTPLIAAAVVAAVAAPLITWLQRHGVGRGPGAGLFLVAGIVLAGGVIVLVLTSQHDELSAQLVNAKDTISGWLTDAGVDRGTADSAMNDATGTVQKVVPALLKGFAAGLKGVSGLAVFLSLTLLSLFFLLKDGPQIRHWAESHMRVPEPVAHRMGDRVIESLHGYFFGVTIVAVFNAVLVLVGALILGVPLAGTIAVVTFVGAYVPYLGAWSAGAFAVLVALGGAGTDAAIGMAIIQLLANGILQQLIQPIAYGAALGIHPLAVLVVTIAGGALFGAVGLILAAPVTSAATRIAADLSTPTTDDQAPASPEPAQAAVP
jgi:predicted PurR-regulated permease PerM